MKRYDTTADNEVLTIDHPAYATILQNIGATFTSDIRMQPLLLKARCAFILGVGPHIPRVNFTTFGLSYRGLSKGYAVTDAAALWKEERERALNFAHLFQVNFLGESFSFPLRGRWLVHRDTGIFQLPSEFVWEISYVALSKRIISRLLETLVMSMREFAMFTWDDYEKIKGSSSWPRGIEVSLK